MFSLPPSFLSITVPHSASTTLALPLALFPSQVGYSTSTKSACLLPTWQSNNQTQPLRRQQLLTMSTVAATNTYSRHTGRYHKKLPVLTIHDIREFVLAYLKNEYSPSSSDHGPLPTSQNTYLHGVRIPSSHLRSPKEPHGRTMPPKSYRWLAIGKSLRHEGASHRAEKQALRDIEKMKQLFLDARVPRGAIEQIEASVRDFSRLDRFSRVRTKLVSNPNLCIKSTKQLTCDESSSGQGWRLAGPRCTPSQRSGAHNRSLASTRDRLLDAGCGC